MVFRLLAISFSMNKPLFAATAALLFGLAGATLPSRAQAPATGAPPGTQTNAATLFSPPNQIQPGTKPPAVFNRVFRRLGHDKATQIPFTESRAFSISKNPVKQTGTLRSTRENGLSMSYESGKPRVLIIDEKGLIERIPGGHERQVSVADHPELSALTDLYLNLLRGNSAKLFDYADVYFAGNSASWQIGLAPKDPTIAKRAGKVVVSGGGRDLRRLENQLPNGDVRVLDLGPIQHNPKFAPEVTKEYFRNDG